MAKITSKADVFAGLNLTHVTLINDRLYASSPFVIAPPTSIRWLYLSGVCVTAWEVGPQTPVWRRLLGADVTRTRAAVRATDALSHRGGC
jgi:hypothetical protein